MSNVYLEKLRSISGKPTVREPPKLPKGAYDSFGSTATTRIPENGAANDTHDLDIAELLARHGDASAGGVDWAPCRLLSDAQASRRWLVVTPLGCTTLTCTSPKTRDEIKQSLRYSTAVPIGDQP
ncbi:hypothetical protein [Thiomonas sp.]|uniref:hypothetical protein n=1 Tax=Thiomonas sp. TaxID=2047785 RepID=UPI002589B58B|nr:hypothetical protein [Thiomonas sp.]